MKRGNKGKKGEKSVEALEYQENGTVVIKAEEGYEGDRSGSSGSSKSSEGDDAKEEEQGGTLEESSINSNNSSSDDLPLEQLHYLLKQTQEENKRLKDLLTKQKGAISITIPIPALNGMGLLQPEQYEQVKVLYSGIVIEMIKTVEQKINEHNKKSYAFYSTQESEQGGQELKATFLTLEEKREEE